MGHKKMVSYANLFEGHDSDRQAVCLCPSLMFPVVIHQGACSWYQQTS